MIFAFFTTLITQSVYNLYSESNLSKLINDIIYECNGKKDLICSSCNQSIEFFVYPIKKINEEQLMFCPDEESACLGCCIFKTDILQEQERGYSFEHKDRTMTYFLHETCYNKLHTAITQKIENLKSNKTLQCYDCRIKFGTWMCLGSLGLLSVLGCLGFGICLATI